MRVIHAIAAIDIQKIPLKQRRAVRGIVVVDPRHARQVRQPDDIRIQRAKRDWILALRRHVPRLVDKRACVAAGQPIHVQRHHLAAIGHGIRAIALDCNRRHNPAPRPIQVRIAVELGHHELPQEMPIFLGETKEHPPIALVARVARAGVVRPDVHAAFGDGRRGVCLRAHLGHPLDVFAAGRVERLRQVRLIRHLVARVSLAPLRAVGRQGTGSHSHKQQARGPDEIAVVHSHSGRALYWHLSPAATVSTRLAYTYPNAAWRRSEKQGKEHS